MRQQKEKGGKMTQQTVGERICFFSIFVSTAILTPILSYALLGQLTSWHVPCERKLPGLPSSCKAFPEIRCILWIITASTQ